MGVKYIHYNFNIVLDTMTVSCGWGKSHIFSVMKSAGGFKNGAHRNSSLFLEESPWYNNYVYGTEGKKAEGRSTIQHMKKLRKGDLLTKKQRESDETEQLKHLSII